MKSILPLLLIVLSAVSFFSCRDDRDDDSLPVPSPSPQKEEQLPPITSTGAGTFGCKVNGKVWVAKSNKDFPEIYASVNRSIDWYLLIAGAQISGESQFDVINLRCYGANSKSNHTLKMLDSTYSAASFTNSVKNQFWNTNAYIGGELSLIRFDTLEQIVAGTFHFNCINIETHDTLRITDGRFDMNFLY